MQSEKPLANQNGKVNVLITAESIIAGFMIAYGALNGQLLVDWSRHHGSLMTTYIAGIVIYAIVLTCFVSIVLLFSSIPTNNREDLDWRYDAGYDLFLTVILGSAVFVVTNGISIHQFTVQSLLPHALPKLPKPIRCFDSVELANVLFYEFLFYPVFLFLLLLVFRHARTNAVKRLARKKVKPLARTRHELLIVLLFATALAVAIALLYVPSARNCIPTLFQPA